LAGCGNMGFAMLAGWVDSKRLDAAKIAVVEPNAALRQRAADKGAQTFESVEAIPGKMRPRLVVMAVKPQIMADLLPAYRRFADGGAAFLTIAAGTRIALFERELGPHVPVIRCMPNTPAAIGEGMIVMVANAHADAELL